MGSACDWESAGQASDIDLGLDIGNSWLDIVLAMWFMCLCLHSLVSIKCFQGSNIFQPLIPKRYQSLCTVPVQLDSQVTSQLVQGCLGISAGQEYQVIS